MAIETETLYKLMIMHMLNKVEFPLTNTQISQFFLENEYTNYFAVQKAINEYPVARYQVVERNKIRIGLFGIIGRDAADDTPFAKSVKFVDPIRASKDVVDILLNKEKVDLIVCLSHSGTLRVKADEKIKKESEDEFLAQEVPQIDVIISGHTHTLLPPPLKIGKTVINKNLYNITVSIILENYSLNQRFLTTTRSF